MVEEVRNINREVLPNGLTVITEEMEHIRSVSIGIWIKTGSRDESAESNGISHFIEHMVFKGTKNRSAEAIARQVDSIGGNMDAFTAKECVCFNVKLLDEHLPIAMDVLSDLVLNPVSAALSSKKSKWMRTTLTTSSTKFSLRTFGKIIRWESPSLGPKIPSANSNGIRFWIFTHSDSPPAP